MACAAAALVLMVSTATAEEAMGVIRKIDADKNTIWVSPASALTAVGVTLKLEVANETEIVDKDGKKIEMKDLKERDQVKVTYKKDGDRAVATKIEKVEGKGK
jgi:Cu/Ag efflux protein CusF